MQFRDHLKNCILPINFSKLTKIDGTYVNPFYNNDDIFSFQGGR